MEDNPNNPDHDSFWSELQEQVILDVSCSSWDAAYAIKCFGEGYKEKTIEGKISKVKFTRGKDRQVRFDVKFPDKKYEKNFTNFNVDYIWKYAREVPPKYQTLRAKYLVDLARAAGMLGDEVEQKKATQTENDEDENEEINVVDNLTTNTKSKRATSVQSSEKAPPKKQKEMCTDYDAFEQSDGEIEKECDSDAEDVDDAELFFDARTAEADDDNVEGGEDEKKGDAPNSIEEFTPDKWVFNEMPGDNNHPFTGISGPRHTLSPDTAIPYDYFCLFVPVYFWARWATYTNAKAEIERAKIDKKGRPWTPTCGAELKAWIASIMFWSFLKLSVSRIFMSTIWIQLLLHVAPIIF